MTEIAERHTIAPYQMRRVIVESPFAGDFEGNLTYVRACMHDCLMRGEAPFASHALYTQPGVLDDQIEVERIHGINAGHAWMYGAHAVVVYTDRGISSGMEAGIRSASFHKIPVEYRTLPGYVARPVPELSPEYVHAVLEIWERDAGGSVIAIDVPEAS